MDFKLDKIMGIQKKVKTVISELRSLSNPQAVEGMARFGINSKNTYGVSIPQLRKIAKRLGTDHQLAQALWQTRIHEARILAGMIEEPERVTAEQMDEWVNDFDSWDVCDQVCLNLFDKTKFVYQKINKWSKDDKEFVKRAGFVLMAVLAVHNKKLGDKEFIKFFPIIKKEAADNRNYVKKAVNWALRQIGKRNGYLRKEAIRLAEEIERIDAKSAKWIARDAIAELRKNFEDKVRARRQKKKGVL